jgi:hypothetical protein
MSERAVATFWFNERAGNILRDATPFRRDGDITAPAWENGCLSFDGSATVVTLPWFPVATVSWEVPGGFTSTGLAWDVVDEAFWVGDFTNSKLVKVSKSGHYLGEISISAPPQGIAYDSSDDTLWWGDSAGHTIHHIDMSGVVQGDSIDTVQNVAGLAYEAASDSIWAVIPISDVIRRYDCADGSLDQTITCSGFCDIMDGLAYDAASDVLYVSDDGSIGAYNETIFKVNAGTGALIATYRIGEGSTQYTVAPEDLTLVGSELWMACDLEYHGSVPGGNRVTRLLPVDDFTLSLGLSVAHDAATQAIVVRGDPTRHGWGLYFTSADALRVYFRDGAAAAYSDYTVPLNTWAHVAVSVTQTTATTYIDGVLQGTTDISGLGLGPEIFQPLYIGASLDSSLPRYCEMSVDHLMIYECAMPAAEVASLYEDAYRNYRVEQQAEYLVAGEGFDIRTMHHYQRLRASVVPVGLPVAIVVFFAFVMRRESHA